MMETNISEEGQPHASGRDPGRIGDAGHSFCYSLSVSQGQWLLFSLSCPSGWIS